MKRSKLTVKETQIVNLSGSIAAGCQPCTRYHINRCKDAGISDEEIHKIIKKTEKIWCGALEEMKLRALKRVLNINNRKLELHQEADNRHDVLIGIMVSYTVNSITLFAEYLQSAKKFEISRNEIFEIIVISKFIYDKAKAHVDILSEESGLEKQKIESDNCTPRCGC